MTRPRKGTLELARNSFSPFFPAGGPTVKGWEQRKGSILLRPARLPSALAHTIVVARKTVACDQRDNFPPQLQFKFPSFYGIETINSTMRY